MKKILILTAKIGSGHITPALSVKSAIEKSHPGDFVIHVADFAYESGAVLTDKFLKSSWNGALTFPFLTNLVFNFLNSLYPFVSSKTLTNSIFRSWLLKGSRYIKKYKPDIVFSTHFLCSSIACSARITESMSYEVITFMTDPFGGHKLWADSRIDKILVSTLKAEEYLFRTGIRKEKITVIPFPLREEFFTESFGIKTAEPEYDKAGSKLTVLVSYGGQGIGKSYRVIRDICKNNLNMRIIAVAGNNKKLHRNLTGLKKRENQNTDLILKGYVEDMSVLMKKSDLMISKAGPASVYESISTRCPMLITHWVGLNEKFAMEFVVENKIGLFIPKRKDLVDFLKVMTREKIRKSYKENIMKLIDNGRIQTPVDKGAQLAAKIITDRFHS